jgi:hypothetical protein
MTKAVLPMIRKRHAMASSFANHRQDSFCHSIAETTSYIQMEQYLQKQVAILN